MRTDDDLEANLRTILEKLPNLKFIVSTLGVLYSANDDAKIPILFVFFRVTVLLHISEMKVIQKERDGF